MAENLCIFDVGAHKGAKENSSYSLGISLVEDVGVSLSVFLDVQRYKEEEAPTTLAQFRLSLATSHTNIAVRSAPRVCLWSSNNIRILYYILQQLNFQRYLHHSLCL